MHVFFGTDGVRVVLLSQLLKRPRSLPDDDATT